MVSSHGRNCTSSCQSATIIAISLPRWSTVRIGQVSVNSEESTHASIISRLMDTSSSEEKRIRIFTPLTWRVYSDLHHMTLWSAYRIERKRTCTLSCPLYRTWQRRHESFTSPNDVDKVTAQILSDHPRIQKWKKAQELLDLHEEVTRRT